MALNSFSICLAVASPDMIVISALLDMSPDSLVMAELSVKWKRCP